MTLSPSIKKPEWLKIRIPDGPNYQKISSLVDKHRLNTVCEEAKCPNLGTCWKAGVATFMIMGDTCTRGCRFCSVNSGKPNALDADEPQKVADSVKQLKLRYAVITSVDRDDLPDQGSTHFHDVVQCIKKENPFTKVEVLTPDFSGNEHFIAKVLESDPEVFGHNIETVERLTKSFRDRRSSFETSLKVLQIVKSKNNQQLTKTSLMVGAGESKVEIFDAMKIIRDYQVDIITIGQYLQPTTKHHPVIRFVHPDEFKEYEDFGRTLGFKGIKASPLTRSSFLAEDVFMQTQIL